MAHSAYHCCAVCDCKLDYGGLTVRTKEDLCARCAVDFYVLTGRKAIDGEAVVRWIEDVGREQALTKLRTIGYSPCRFENAVDSALGVQLR